MDGSDHNVEILGIQPLDERKGHLSTWEIRYEPNVEAERLHQDRDVTVKVVGVNDRGEIDYSHPCQVTWTVVGIEAPQALPYGCEWRLESYWTTCTPSSK